MGRLSRTIARHGTGRYCSDTVLIARQPGLVNEKQMQAGIRDRSIQKQIPFPAVVTEPDETLDKGDVIGAAGMAA